MSVEPMEMITEEGDEMRKIYTRDDNKRPFRTNLTLNEYENDMLNLKAAKCGMDKSRYLRELICSSCPVEAPPPAFYWVYDDLNKIGVNINQIAATGNATGFISPEDVEYLKRSVEEIKKRLTEMRQIVLSSKPYSATYFEALALAEKEAKKRGEEPPTELDEIIPPVEYKDEDYKTEDYPFDVTKKRRKKRTIRVQKKQGD